MAAKKETTTNTSHDTESTESAATETISAKSFISTLKTELKDQKIPDAVYIAFKTVVNKTDTEENYRKIWTTTFKRA